MCRVRSCPQQRYYESTKGYCYFHHKQFLNLIPKSDRQYYLSAADANTLYVTRYLKRSNIVKKYNRMAYRVSKTVSGLYTSVNFDDLLQESLAHLWVIADRINPTFSKRQISKFIFINLRQHLQHYAHNISSTISVTKHKRVTLPVTILYVDELFDTSDWEQIDNLIDRYRKVDKCNDIVISFAESLDELERELFYDLFLSEQEFSLREIGRSYSKSHEWVRKFGHRLFSKFGEFVEENNCQITDFI